MAVTRVNASIRELSAAALLQPTYLPSAVFSAEMSFQPSVAFRCFPMTTRRTSFTLRRP